MSESPSVLPSAPPAPPSMKAMLPLKYDFFGDSAIKGGKHDIGVDEVR